MENVKETLCLLEINKTGAVVTDPMTPYMLQEFILAKFRDQPINYFNQEKRLWVINIETTDIRPVSLKVEI